MLRHKIGIVWATVIFAIVIGMSLFNWLKYYWALKDQEREWYKTQYIEKEFKGVIKEIGDYSYNPDFQKEFLSLTISTTDTLEQEIHYGC